MKVWIDDTESKRRRKKTKRLRADRHRETEICTLIKQRIAPLP